MQKLRWATPDFDPSEISILVVSNYNYCQIISDDLIESNRRSRSRPVKVHTCESVHDMVTSKHNKLHIDYIVIVVDVSRVNGVLEVEDNLSLIDESFLMGKLCFLNVCTDPEHVRSVSVDDLWALQAKYKVPLLNGNIKTLYKRLHLAGRILNLIRASLGLETGFPFFGSAS